MHRPQEDEWPLRRSTPNTTLPKASDCSAGALPRRIIEPDITPYAQRATPLQLEDGSEIERPFYWVGGQDLAGF